MKKYATCEDCKTEMVPGGKCTVKFYQLKNNKKIKRLLYNDPDGNNCHDCNVASGSYHHSGCDWEKCPNCGIQMISCGFECLS